MLEKEMLVTSIALLMLERSKQCSLSAVRYGVHTCAFVD